MKNVRYFALFILPSAFFFACVFPCALPAETAGRAIRRIDVEGLFSISKEELLHLLDIKVGEVLDPDKVRTGIKRAFLKGIFDDIEVYADTERIELRVLVEERERIRKVSITGNEYLSARDIRNIFLLKEGQVMRYDLIDDAVKRLKEGLAERGFPNATASVVVSPTSKPYAKDLTITVNEGKPLLIDRIVIHGVPDEDMRGSMRIREGDVYEEKVLKKDLEKIKEYYKGHGYLNPLVSFRYETGRLDMDVTKGKKLKVNFEGNTVFSSRRLTKEMPFIQAGEVRDDLIEDATRKITSLYHGKGYAFVQVAPVISGPAVDTIGLNFFIFEGESVTVGVLRFPGMTLPEKNLKEVLPLKEGNDYNPELLSSDIDVVREFYTALGYMGVEVEAPSVSMEQNKAMITIPVKEGPKTLIDRIEITGGVSVPPEEIRRVIGLKEGSPYNEVDIADARARVINLYLERGFIDVAINARVEFAGERARITFEIQEGGRTFFGKTIITGNTRTRTEVVERELLQRESEPFNYDILAKERQRLHKLGLFTDVRIEGLDRYDHQSDVHVDVVEGNPGSVDFGFGYSNYDKLNGFVDIGYKDLFGMNRQVSLRVGYNSLEKLYAINYYDPWFLAKPLPFKVTVYRRDRDEENIDTKVVMYSYRKYGFSLGVEKQYTSTMKGTVYYEYVLSNTFNVQPDIILTDRDTGKLGISSIRPGITYDSRDDPFNPRKGILAGLSMEVASSAIFSQADFAKVVFNGSLYQELSKPFVVAAAFRTGVAHGWGNSEILPLVERFFLGGRSSVRGYAQDTLGPRGVNGNPTGGNAFVETNLELRTFLGKGIGLVTFLDSGNVWQKVDDIDLSLKHAVGMGLRYDTPVGPFRLDYGYKLKKETGLSRGELFFSIGQAF